MPLTDKEFWLAVTEILKDPELSKEFFKKMGELDGNNES